MNGLKTRQGKVLPCVWLKTKCQCCWNLQFFLHLHHRNSALEIHVSVHQARHLVLRLLSVSMCVHTHSVHFYTQCFGMTHIRAHVKICSTHWWNPSSCRLQNARIHYIVWNISLNAAFSWSQTAMVCHIVWKGTHAHLNVFPSQCGIWQHFVAPSLCNKISHIAKWGFHEWVSAMWPLKGLEHCLVKRNDRCCDPIDHFSQRVHTPMMLETRSQHKLSISPKTLICLLIVSPHLHPTSQSAPQGAFV